MKYLLVILIAATMVCLMGCEASRSLKTAQKTQALKPVGSLGHAAQGDQSQPTANVELGQSQARVTSGQ